MIKQVSREQSGTEQPPLPNVNHINVRTARDGDEPEIQRLYTDGALSRIVNTADLALDIRFPQTVYFSGDLGRMWVADAGEHLVGMIAVMHDHESVGTIHRLRVDPVWRETDLIPRLLRPLLAYCREHGYLKVIFDTETDASDALRLFEREGLRCSRRRRVQTRELIEFYVDLYQPPMRPGADGPMRGQTMLLPVPRRRVG